MAQRQGTKRGKGRPDYIKWMLIAGAVVVTAVLLVLVAKRQHLFHHNVDIDHRQYPVAGIDVAKSVLLLVIGLACLVVGSNIFVNGATAVAQQLGVSEAVIGLTVVAGGTSLPELATSVVAARKGNSGIAIGNVLGSNVMNILLILGGAGLICPMQVKDITIVDFSVLTGSILLIWLFSNTKLTVARWEGAVLTILFLAYMVWLVASAV